MSPRFKAFLMKVVYTSICVLLVVSILALIIFLNIDNLFLSFGLFCLAAAIVICGAVRFLFNTEETIFDENGITAYRFKEKDIFCSWSSITKVELRILPRVGKMIFIYNDKYTEFSPFEIKSAEHDALSLVYTSKVIGAIRFHRLDLEIERIHS